MLDHNTVVSFYGRAFSPHESMDNMAILGRLGYYDNFDQFYDAVLEYAGQVDAANGNLGVIPAMNIIYELASATQELGGGTFLVNVEGYLAAFDAGTLAENYIKPAEEKGVLVFLDNQLGLSSVREQAESMLAFLEEYTNVHFFFDPEFHIYPEQFESGEVTIPGRPIPGHIDAEDINQALAAIRNFMTEKGIEREVIVGLHGFEDSNVMYDNRDMIVGKNDIVIPPGITLIIDADGFSASENSQAIKWTKYMGITDPEVYKIFGNGAYPGIKIFPPNAYVTSGQFDNDLFTPRQLMGLDPIRSGQYFERRPAMIILN